MTNDIFNIRLHQARLLSGLSMERLAAMTNGTVTKQSISKYEAGLMRPKQRTLRVLAEALNISESYFTGAGIQIDVPTLRVTSNRLTDIDIENLDAILSFWTEQYISKEKAMNMSTHFTNPISDFHVTDFNDAIKAAELLRDRWKCGDGPLPYVIRLLERKGVKIKALDLPDNVWGISAWANQTQPLILLDIRPGKTSVERLRFTVCHELGHLVLNIDSNNNTEKLCDKFASFFLLPKQTFIEEIGNERRDKLLLSEMIDIKEIYGVSVAAQVHEAYDIGMISEDHYNWWYDEMIKNNIQEKGWGDYRYQETPGREMRLDTMLKELSNYE